MKKYILQEWLEPGIWMPIVLPTYRRSLVWYRYYISTAFAHTTYIRRDATQVYFLPALLYWVYLNLAHKRWRRNRIKIFKVIPVNDYRKFIV